MRTVGIFSSRKGQSAVETALVLPIIILVLLGIVDFGLMFNNYLVINNAAREGARSAAVGLNDTEIGSRITALTTTLDNKKIKTTISPLDASRKKGDSVTVTVEYDYSLITPVVGAVVPNPVHLTAKTVMRVE